MKNFLVLWVGFVVDGSLGSEVWSSRLGASLGVSNGMVVEGSELGAKLGKMLSICLAGHWEIYLVDHFLEEYHWVKSCLEYHWDTTSLVAGQWVGIPVGLSALGSMLGKKHDWELCLVYLIEGFNSGRWSGWGGNRHGFLWLTMKFFHVSIIIWRKRTM